MSRLSPGRNSASWHAAVIQWYKRKVKRFYAKRRLTEKALGLSRLRVSIRPPYPLSRFVYELGDRVEWATAGDVESASRIVAYYCTTRKDKIDQRVVAFMERARRRYVADSRCDIPKALLLTRPTRGNPGREARSISKRQMRLSQEQLKEIGIAVRNAMRGSPGRRSMLYEDAVQVVAKQYAVGMRTVERGYAMVKLSRKETELVSGKSKVDWEQERKEAPPRLRALENARRLKATLKKR